MDLRRLAKNVSSQWIALVAQLVVGLAMAPFLMHRLGPDAYGIIALVSGLVGYSGVLYLGLGAAIVKYVAEHHARNEQDALNETVSTIFTVYLYIGLFCLLACLVLAVPLPWMFRIPHRLAFQSQLMMAMMGVALLAQFLGSVYAGVLMGLERFDVINVRSLILLALRTVLLVVAVLRWPSLVVVGTITLVGAIAEQGIAIQFVWKIMPGLRVTPRLFQRRRLKQLFTFSSQSFLFTLSERLINYSSEFVISNALGPRSVTWYVMPLRLVDYAREGVDKATVVLMPGISAAAARGEGNRLKGLWRAASKAVFALIMPLALIFIVWGRELLTLWLDARAAREGYRALVILALAFIVQMSGRGIARPLFEGLGELTMPARITIIEGVVNLTLAVVLVRVLGIEGVALAGLLPAAVTGVFVMPWFVCRRLGLSYPRHLLDTFVRSLPPLLPAWLVLLGAQRLGLHRHLATAGATCLAALLAYLVAALFVMFDRSEREAVLGPVRRLLARRPPDDGGPGPTH